MASWEQKITIPNIETVYQNHNHDNSHDNFRWFEAYKPAGLKIMHSLIKAMRTDLLSVNLYVNNNKQVFVLIYQTNKPQWKLSLKKNLTVKSHVMNQMR